MGTKEVRSTRGQVGPRATVCTVALLSLCQHCRSTALNVEELMLYPDSSGCPRPLRMGDTGDGGWWTCQTWRAPCIGYSYGIRDNWSFDKALADKGCKVHGFDPSKAGLASRDAYTHHVPATYHSSGLGGEDKTYAPGQVPFEWPGIDYLRDTNSDPWELATVSSTMRRLNHHHVTILKVDVEGSEWAALPDIILNASWSQLLIELHFAPNSYRLERLRRGGARVIRIDSNTRPMRHLLLVQRLARIATLWKLDFNGESCLELSYVRRSQSLSKSAVVPFKSDRKTNIIENNILWSRNWHNLVDCNSVPQSYYEKPTWRAHTPCEMVKYFAGCGGFVWVRSNDAGTFAKYVLPRMTKPFTLITTDGDDSVPRDVVGASAILDHALLETWYTQNYDGSISSPRLKPVPIGFDLHTDWPGLWHDNATANIQEMLMMRREALLRNRSKVPFVPYWSPTHGDRNLVDAAIECVRHVHGKKLCIDRLWDSYGTQTFAFAPRGGGCERGVSTFHAVHSD
jgi:hypothetical protein